MASLRAAALKQALTDQHRPGKRAGRNDLRAPGAAVIVELLLADRDVLKLRRFDDAARGFPRLPALKEAGEQRHTVRELRAHGAGRPVGKNRVAEQPAAQQQRTQAAAQDGGVREQAQALKGLEERMLPQQGERVKQAGVRERQRPLELAYPIFCDAMVVQRDRHQIHVVAGPVILKRHHEIA